jgi:hypothetical protein
MKVIIGIATFGNRGEFLKQAVNSLQGQADEIRIYDNNKEVDLNSNGKFYFLHEYKEPIYYFSCDDDIIYPPTYVQDMVAAIEKYKAIVTHHGRVLNGLDKDYYYGHRQYCFSRYNGECIYIDTAGTGVTAFRTDYFNPVDLCYNEKGRMTDLLFGLEAIKQDKKIVLLPHKASYFKALKVPALETIHGVHAKQKCKVRMNLANEIWKRKKC